jgi:hypothetical protein
MATDLLFGLSLQLDDGDLVLSDGPQISLKTISGVPNALQALVVRVLTPFGSDIFNVTYGLDVRQALVEPHDIRTAKQLLKLSLVQTLATDPRVLDVRDILFKDDPAYKDRHPEFSPTDLQELIRRDRTSRSWSVDVLIDLVSAPGQAVSVRIGA